MMIIMIMMTMKLALRKTLKEEGRKKERKKDKKNLRLTCSCDNHFLAKTLFVILNIYLNNRCTFFPFCTMNIIKTIIISFVYIYEKENET